ncbi:AEC family transporter [Endozoicomonas sp. G2_2]|uniref:AEC family transporter n=1 Tax=Endozoicomonas sp. G2_2 TaxID=2821092 RepID=UPI001AD9DE7C|nr:AEC family transporter [Endozoicomonas sp. G2_2]MBO9469312.1 AEC family transporter [Endozoicomonas sp. G2_2]
MDLFAVFLQTLNVTLPVFSMVFLGIGLKKAGWIDDRFIDTASTLVFKGSMPTLVFISIVKADLSQALLPGLMAFFTVATFACFGLTWLWAIWRVERIERGVYVQGAFRGNCGIVGLALAASMYGDFGLSAGGILVGLVILLYNTLSVLILTWYQPDQQADWRSISRGIATNPLIIGTVVAIPVAAIGAPIPEWLMTSGEYFARLTLPLALICIGGTLSLGALYEARGIAFSASLIKMVIFPAGATLAAWLCGFAGRELGLLYLFFATPSAAASFIMVQAMGGNARLAANIVAVTTLAASATITAGVFTLTALGVI